MERVIYNYLSCFQPIVAITSYIQYTIQVIVFFVLILYATITSTSIAKSGLTILRLFMYDLYGLHDL